MLKAIHFARDMSISKLEVEMDATMLQDAILSTAHDYAPEAPFTGTSDSFCFLSLLSLKSCIVLEQSG